MSFHRIGHFVCYAKASGFDVFPLADLLFDVRALGVLSKKSSYMPASESVSPMFSSTKFIVSGLEFRSLIHLEVIFVLT